MRHSDNNNAVRVISRRGLLFSAFAALRAGGQDTTFSADVKVVNVLATVRNKQGQIIQNLNKDDFTLEEDARPQTISYFSRESNLPLTLGLLIDTSMSQRRVLGQERTASYRFLDQVLREDKDMAFVIHFDREVELLEDLTSSRKKLESALTSIETPQPQQRGGGGGGYPGSRGGGHRGGGTKLYDAVLLASDEIMKKQHGRKALIVLSDGVDNGSKVSLTSAIETAQRADTMVYSILFADEEGYGQRGGGFGGGGMGRRGGYPRSRYPQSRPDGKKILEQISKETGGGFFEVSKKLPVDQIYSRLEEELRNQYSLGYTPDKADPGFHKISLTVKQKGLIVQARDGYYAGR
ncbi:MAG: VWA domain-containing protein [Acidobacteriia bacterium]|nr:VWA domain-containing protein [Terriglobia bacterium]